MEFLEGLRNKAAPIIGGKEYRQFYKRIPDVYDLLPADPEEISISRERKRVSLEGFRPPHFLSSILTQLEVNHSQRDHPELIFTLSREKEIFRLAFHFEDKNIVYFRGEMSDLRSPKCGIGDPFDNFIAKISLDEGSKRVWKQAEIASEWNDSSRKQRLKHLNDLLNSIEETFGEMAISMT